MLNQEWYATVWLVLGEISQLSVWFQDQLQISKDSCNKLHLQI